MLTELGGGFYVAAFFYAVWQGGGDFQGNNLVGGKFFFGDYFAVDKVVGYSVVDVAAGF